MNAVMVALWLGGLGSVVLLGLATAARRVRGRQDADRTSFVLAFPRDVQAEHVLAVLRSVSGLGRDNPWSARSLVFEALGTPSGIEHRLHVPTAWAEPVRSRLLVELPGLGLEQLAEAKPPRFTRGLELALTDEVAALRTDNPALTNRAVLTALQPVNQGEAVMVQWVIAPLGVGPRPVSRLQTRRAPADLIDLLTGLWSQAAVSPERISPALQRVKVAEPLFRGVVRVVAGSSQRGRALHLVTRLRSALAVSEAAGSRLAPRWMWPSRVARKAVVRRTPQWWAASVNAAELAAALAWPVGNPTVPGLAVRRSRWFAPAVELPRVGRVLGDGIDQGVMRPVAQSLVQAKTHTWVLGKTGAGKSTLLANLALQDMALPERPAVVVIEPKGDLVADLLVRIPEHRRRDVILLDPASDVLVGLNPMRLDEPDRELVADEVYGVFQKLSSSWGPRLGDVLYNALQTLAHQPDAALTELPLLLADDAYRRRALARLGTDGWVLRSFWAGYDALSAAERANVAAPILTRIRPWVTRTRLRHLIGVPHPRWTFRDVLNDGRILLVSLNTGLLGQETVRLLGSLIFQSLWQAATSRATLPHDQRRTALVYADEWQDYTHLPTNLETALSQARGYGLGFVLANQSVTQLSNDLKAAVTVHARSKVVMSVSNQDALHLAREIGGGVTPDDVQGLGAHEAIASLMAGDQTAPPVSLRTRPLGDPLTDLAPMRELVRERYGLDPADVERALRSRHEPPAPELTSNRRKRSS